MKVDLDISNSWKIRFLYPVESFKVSQPWIFSQAIDIFENA